MRDGLDRERVDVVAVAVERRLLVPMLLVAQQLHRPVGVGTMRADAIDSPDADHLRPRERRGRAVR